MAVAQPKLRSIKALAEEDLALPPFYVEPLITPDSTTLIFGPREAGKTQLVFTLFKAIQEQGFLFGRYRCQRIRAALVEVDMPIVQVQKRAQLAIAHFPFDDDLFRILELRSLDLAQTTPDAPWVQALREFDPQMVIFDSLRKSHSLSEIDTGTPSRVYNAARLCFPDAARVFLHHPAKAPLYMSQGDTPRSPEDAFRGTGAWLDDADTGIALDRKAQRRTFQIVRGRHTEEDIKQEVVEVHFNKDSLLLEAAEQGPIVLLYSWYSAHPAADRTEAMAWLAQEFPRKSHRSYQRWCAAIGL